MKTNRRRDGLLTGIGLGAWLIYVLACTSFSPDDSKILFPTFDPKSGSLALGLYDREARATETLLTLQPAPEETALRGVWMPDGRRVVALWPEETGGNQLRVMVLPLKTREPTRLLAVTGIDDLGACLVTPPPIVGSHLFLGAESLILRLDLESGEVTTNEVEGEIALIAQRERVYYWRSLPAADDSSKERCEVGRLDMRTLNCVPLFQIPEQPGREVRGFLAVSREGSRIALPAEQDGVPSVLIFDGREMSRTIPAAAKGEEVRLGNLQWSSDSATLYATCFKAAGPERCQYGVLELPVGGGPGRFLSLFGVSGTSDERDELLIQIDLSHDGKTLAVASTYLAMSGASGRVKPEDVALYLVDVSHPDRKVTRVPVPAPRAAGPAAEGKP